jgi:hypothetical protein
MFPFILFSKKRYAGLLYEDDAEKTPKLKSMGIALKRRDNAPIVKTIFGGILDRLLKEQDLVASVAFLRLQLQSLVDGRAPLEELVITKALKGHYKSPQTIAHKVLADRMGERDAGNKPQANDRIPFVYIVPPNGAVVRLQGERIETPDYIRAHNLKPDYRHYITNQIMTPVCQLYALCVEQLPGYGFSPGYWVQMEEELSVQTLYAGKPKRMMERLATLKMRTVEALLFEPFISRLECVNIAKKPSKNSAQSSVKNRLAAAIIAVGDRADDGVARTRGGRLTDPVIVQVRVVEHAKPKRFEGRVVIRTGAGEVWHEHTEVCKSQGKIAIYTKTTVGALMMQRALEYALVVDKDKDERRAEQRAAIRQQGLRFDLEAVVEKAWLKALEKKETLHEELEKANAECDVRARNELEHLNRFQLIVHSDLPYDFTLAA